ncbi:MAG: histidine kinase [Lachnospiraceae bacterium]|nr:histidine kinase [Lachnospiraceae bacterium]
MEFLVNQEQTGILVSTGEFSNLESDSLEKHIILLQEHFLFNALNTIKGAVILKRSEALKLVDDFAVCLRYQFQCIRSTDKMPLSNECKFLQFYISLEQMRFPGLSVEWDVQEAPIFVPPMCTSLLLSKSIQECLASPERKVKIAGKLEHDNYVFQIWNSVDEEHNAFGETIEQTRKTVALWCELQSKAKLCWEKRGEGILLTARIPRME